MHNTSLTFTAFALAGALLGGGCAHETGTAMVRPEPGAGAPVAAADNRPAAAALAGDKPAPALSDSGPDSGAEAKAVVKGPPRIKPENDARYHLPEAQKRGLNIYLGSQTFEYLEDGEVFLSGRISSGSKEHPTPAGNFQVLSKIKDKRSGKYTNGLDENTPMPYSLQFTGPYFVHEGWVPGWADSHGCVRLNYEDARLLFDRIKVGDPVKVKSDGEAQLAGTFSDLVPVF